MNKNPIELHADTITEYCLYEARKVLGNVKDLAHLDQVQRDTLYFAMMQALMPTDSLVKSMSSYALDTVYRERQKEDTAKAEFSACLDFSIDSPLTKLGVTKEQVERQCFEKPESASELSKKVHNMLRQLHVNEEELEKHMG